MLLDGVPLLMRSRLRRIVKCRWTQSEWVRQETDGPTFLSPLGLKEFTQDMSTFIGQDTGSDLRTMRQPTITHYIP